VGARILVRLEALALARRAGHLKLDASVNAEAFYVVHGYRRVDHRTCRLASGRGMPCVRIVKVFAVG
jgi:hypothetical protein